MHYHFLFKFTICVTFFYLYTVSTAVFGQDQESKTIETDVSQPSQEQAEDSLGWGDWQQGVLAIDLSTLPLTPKQRTILADKIAQLKTDFGVGVSGEIEQAISQLDASTLVNDNTGTKRQLNSDKSRMINKFHDDLLLEEEILALEFANAKPFDDPEGLSSGSDTNKLLFDSIFARLLLLEKQQLQALDEKE